MDKQQAKTILLAYRPGFSDEKDPHVAEALDLAKRDPELARWLEEQNAFYAAVRTKLKDAPVAADLKQQILAGRKIVRPAIWWRRPTMLAAAAMLALLIGVTAILMNAPHGGLDGYRAQMVQFVADGYKKDVEVESHAELQEVFRRKQWPFDYVIPKPLQAIPLEGGCALDWKGHRVSLLCFEPAEHKDVWFFVVDRAAVPDAPTGETPQFATVGRLFTITWTIGDKTYLLTGELPDESLKQLLRK